VSAHTPGPWMIDLETANSTDPLVMELLVVAKCPRDKQEFIVAEVYGIDAAGDHDERSQANARLIAAAPELLGALRALLSVAPARAPAAGLLVGAEEKHSAAIKAARAAIAKATGGAS
jgi:hypothetical protein